QHMHVGAQLLEPLLVLDAEMLLLIDDEEAEVAEFDALGKKRMGSDHDVNFTLGESLLHRLQLLAADEARSLRKPQRQTLEALRERGVVLTREQRRRHDDRHLLAVHRRDKGRAQSDLRLAEADVAANEP